MKKYGSIRKVMLMVLLSILGSYCIGSDLPEDTKMNSYDIVMQSAYGFMQSIGTYCHKLWSEIAGKVYSIFYTHDDHKVMIQSIDDGVHGNEASCTDGRDDCVYNNRFFNDSYITGNLDVDPTTHLDWDSDPMTLIEDDYVPRETVTKSNFAAVAT